MSYDLIKNVGDNVVYALANASLYNCDGLVFSTSTYQAEDINSALRFGSRLFNGIDSLIASDYPDLYTSYVEYVNTRLPEFGWENMTYDDIKAMCN